MSRATIMAMHSATSRRGCRPPCDRMRSSPSLRNMPNAAAAVQALKTRKPFQVVDLRESSAYRNGDPLVVNGVDVAGVRTLLAVPMFKDKNRW